MVGLCICWGISFFFGLLFVCKTNFWAFWASIATLKAHCGQILNHQFWLAISDFVIDVIIFLIPIPLVRTTPPIKAVRLTPDRYGD